VAIAYVGADTARAENPDRVGIYSVAALRRARLPRGRGADLATLSVRAAAPERSTFKIASAICRGAFTAGVGAGEEVVFAPDGNRAVILPTSGKK
jgi:hypothetical protein